MKQYGMPVFGTVQEENPIAWTTPWRCTGENREGVAIFRGIPYGGACEGRDAFCRRFRQRLEAVSGIVPEMGTARYKTAAVSPAVRSRLLFQRR